jgi:hypothetical protein
MKNAGYTIIQSEIYDVVNMYGVALGFNGTSYVTWEFTVTEKEYSFYWGHYFSDPFAVSLDYHERLIKKYREVIERREKK